MHHPRRSVRDLPPARSSHTSHLPPSTPDPLPIVLPYRLPPSPAETEKAYSDSADSACAGIDEVDDHRSNKEDGRPHPYALPPPSHNNVVLPEDLKTPDRHVERDPRLIRLTGVHPFNSEAPLSELFSQGFLTSKDLHFVRNHGAVPLVADEEALNWVFSIEGMVAEPMAMTLRHLLADYEQYTYPITLVCAGNRRKEQNMVRKTRGFSWGAAGLSTALWTGVPLAHLLERARPLRGARFVCLEGADKLPNGHYGTSVKLTWARDQERGILVAHKMNGEPLPADHGKPLRLVVPGQIGGRSVKWLKRIVVTAEPSDSWYHIYDNRVLPTAISPEASTDLTAVWKDERYAIYDLNTNSAICFPAHGERVLVQAAGPRNDASASNTAYRVRGYAYAGGGKRVTRVEITLDKGASWRLAELVYPEDAYRMAAEGERLYGGLIDMVAERESCFCWCFWHLDIALAELWTATDVMVRCMDDSMMVQPRDIYWSVLGMMNNPWFRVVIHKEGGGSGGEQRELWFEHPAPPKPSDKGWMERVKLTVGGDLTNGYWGEKIGEPGQTAEDSGSEQREQGDIKPPAKDICMTDPDKVHRVISLQKMRQHENDDAPWFVVHGHVYDGTAFLDGHPGGAASITGVAGQDVTEDFMAIHSENAKNMMAAYHVGRMDPSALAQLGTSGGSEEAAAPPQQPRPVFLQTKTWAKAMLTAKTSVSPDSKIFTFGLEHADQRLGLPVGQHMMLRLRDPVTREVIVRAYTPLTVDMADLATAALLRPQEKHRQQKQRGAVDLLVKIYRDAPGRPGGRMTQALDQLPIGHTVDVKGPVGHFSYLGGGWCAIGSTTSTVSTASTARRRHVRRFVMLCGGSGITPIFQVLRAVLAEDASATGSAPATSCLVLDANRTEEDILCRTKLDALVAAHPDRCRVVHVLSQAPDSWTGLRGRVDAKLLRSEVGALPASALARPRHANSSSSSSRPTGQSAEPGNLVLVCGPKALETSVRENLMDLGWRREDMHFF